MLDLSTLTAEQYARLDEAVAAGLRVIGVEDPLTLDEWAREHFYLSAESSYVEQAWTPWPFQRAIMACISNDDIEEVDLKKSARVGYTKIILAAIGYNAEHRRRNQCIWQPTDDDSDDFTKSELEPMLRDVKVMHRVFPKHMARHKDNTLQQKRFIGSMLRMRGGKAAKNYRRISIDVAYIDEADAFDRDVEKEGDPITLARKRIEGATFPKLVVGSTPKLHGFSLISGRFDLADQRFAQNVRCVHCQNLHPITWGGKDEPHGFKWVDNNPDTVAHLCPHCGCLMTQAEFLAVADAGVFVNHDGTIHLHNDGRFTTPDGTLLPTPRHVGLSVWTAYSPSVAWSAIVREFLAAWEKHQEGDDTKLQAFTNTTLGETWEGDIEKTDADDLRARAEPFPLRQVPRDCLLLLCGADGQDNRAEFGVWGLGRGGQMWTIDHHVVFGNPATSEFWDECEQFLRNTAYTNAWGIDVPIYACAVDTGGHHADAVYAFAHRLKHLRVHAIKGASARERSIEHSNSKVQYRWNGRVERNGPTLWTVGTNLAKDRFQSRLDIRTPGPGYVHLSSDLSDEWFKQLASEDRVTRRMAWGTESRWVPNRKRNEVRDCMAYSIFLEERLGLWRPGKRAFWDALEKALQPEGDLFAAMARPREPAVEVPRGTSAPAVSAPASPPPIRKPPPVTPVRRRDW